MKTPQSKTVAPEPTFKGTKITDFPNTLTTRPLVTTESKQDTYNRLNHTKWKGLSYE